MKTALLIIYNHRFDKNIPRLDALYDGVFSHVYHVVPFYDGAQPNVIPVYESSYRFQSYISQAYTHLKDKGFTHFFVVADDMLLHPSINEHTLWDALGLEPDACFLPCFQSLQRESVGWPWLRTAISWRLRQPGLEVERILPSREEAEQRFRRLGLDVGPIPASAYRRVYQGTKNILRPSFWREVGTWAKRSIATEYPFVGGYSDILLVTAECMERFCTYCGAFAAGGLFVEIAVPTSMVLAADKIRTHKDLKLKYGALWSEQDRAFLEPYKHSLRALQENFPADRMYLHPIKLSQWK